MPNFVKAGNNYINLDRVAVVWDRPNDNLTTVIFGWIADHDKPGRLKPEAVDLTDREERDVVLKAIGAPL